MPRNVQVGEGLSCDDVQKRWKCFRDRFVREQKKIKEKKSGDPGPKLNDRDTFDFKI